MNFIKVILKLECLFYYNIYYFILFYIRRAILTYPKKDLIEKKTCQIKKLILWNFFSKFKQLVDTNWNSEKWRYSNSNWFLEKNTIYTNFLWFLMKVNLFQ